jgi:hypothetical protein
VTALFDELAADLRDGRALAARRVFIDPFAHLTYTPRFAM